MPYDSIIDRSGAEALIPVAEANEIIQGMPKESAALAMFKRVQMTTKQTRQRVLDTLPQAYFVNGDTGLKQTTDVDWKNQFLVAEEIAVIVPIPDAVVDDADIDLWAEIKPLIIEAFAAKIDGAVFFGIDKPATWGKSVLQHAVDAGNVLVRGALAGRDLAGDVSDLMSLNEDDGFDVNGFVARKAIKGSLRGLRDANGGLLFQPSLQAGTPSTLYGEQLEYLENGAWDNAQADLMAVDKTKGIVGLRQDITFKMFDSGVVTDNAGNIIYNLMQQDMKALRAVMRMAWQTANPINRQNQTEANRSPFSVLRPKNFV